MTEHYQLFALGWAPKQKSVQYVPNPLIAYYIGSIEQQFPSAQWLN